ncbi:RICIN domain-containing protein [Streptomyces goshikiensis]|uniref:RICIN domain-containing protein n=1 Tax=Streptomyces goshikiensis TaxID=1942 RepID=UPI0036B98ACE
MSKRQFRRAVLLCAFTLASLMGANGAAGTAQADPAQAQSPEVYRFRNLETLRCLDVRDESYSNSVAIQQYKCKDGRNQQFGLAPKSSGAFTLRTYRSYACVDPRSGTYDGAGVEQWTCNWSDSQEWRMDYIHDNIVVLRHVWSGKCLQDMGQPDGERREVGLMPCTGASSQAWRTEPR